MPALSLYVHIPFCERKCPYCDFNTYAGLQRLYTPLTQALVLEIEAAGRARQRPEVQTIFLGGGTPTVLAPELLGLILDACHRAFAVVLDAEITSEANPGTVDAEKFAHLRELGVNRLSLGVQSFDDRELAFLGRIHDAEQAEAACWTARAAGFDNINLDLIYGLPEQTPESWRRTLQHATRLRPEHLSLYSLTVEDRTPFAEWASSGRISYPDPDQAADLYELADRILAREGYVQYEISNWARDDQPSSMAAAGSNPSFACRHNLVYWHNEAYLGFGPGAHSAEEGQHPSEGVRGAVHVRWANVRGVADYIHRIGTGSVELVRGAAADWFEETDERQALAETMMLGLRLVREGVPYDGFQEKHGRPLLEAFGSEVAELEQLGLVERTTERVRLTQKARLVGNQVFLRFLP